MRTALLKYAQANAADSRVLETVELPKRGAGWFNLISNSWVDDLEPSVDGNEALISGLFRKVQRLESELKELRNSLVHH